MRLIRAFFLSIAVAAVAATSVPSRSQEAISDSHLAAALDAFLASRSGAPFNEILPDVANQVATILIQQRPDLFRQIETAVQEAAAGLVPRRQELNNDIARIWAQHFTEEELRVIAEFYRTTAGQKFAADGPVLIGESLSAAQNWGERLGEELLEATRLRLEQGGVQF